jgi:hypothetical protein
MSELVKGFGINMFFLLQKMLQWQCRGVYLVLIIFSVIAQLFGNGDGFGNFLEHNTIGGGCIFYLYQKCTEAAEIHFYDYFRRYGMYALQLKKT